MASALAQQLRAIQQADQTLGQSFPSGKRASFLFDPKEAADYDAQAIYDLGLAGLAELQQLDPIFLKYQPILFSSTAVDMDRALLTQKENLEIDRHIKTFLRYLSSYFLQKPAHKVLEWLIRKYKINEMNVDDLVGSILPYHETPGFVRMVQILFFKEDDKWGFLFDVKKNAKMINRTFLAIRCTVDRTIIDSVFDSVMWHAENASGMRKKNVHVLPFFTYLCMEYLENLKKIELVHVAHLIKIISKFMISKGSPDLHLSAFMLLSRLADKFSLSEKALGELMILAAKNAAETVASELLLLFCDLVIRGRIEKVPAEAWDAFLSLSNASAAIKKASGNYAIKPILSQLELHIKDDSKNATLLEALKSQIM